ncbi:hypothetical protein ACKVMT_09160 [Halobacteriales archaeon Cl-PHB]
MSDRVPSDHDSLSSHRTSLESVGRTSRLRVPLPETLDEPLAAEDEIELSLEGNSCHARVESTLGGDLCVERAADNARLARTGEGEDRLAAWLDGVGLAAGDPVLVDEVTPGYKLGVRRPGERVIYAATEPPSDSLADIARDIED